MVFEQKYTNDKLIEILKDLAVELERTPRMIDLMKRKGGPYPSLYQKRFSSGGIKDDGWNNALGLAGLGFNRKKVDQESDCIDCGVDGFSDRGRLIRWKGSDDLVCMACYQKRYYRIKRDGGSNDT